MTQAHPNRIIPPNHKVLNVLEKLLIHNKRPSLRTLEILADLYKIEVTLLEQWFHVQIMLKLNYKLQIKKRNSNSQIVRKLRQFDIITSIQLNI